MPFNRFGKWEPLLRKPSFANTQINSCQAIERATQKYCNFKLYSNNLDYCRECGIYVCARHSFSRYMEHKVCDSCYAKLRKFSIGRRASSTCLHNGKDYLGYEFLGYHGTTKISAEAIMKNGPSTNCVKFGIESTLDSGEGFYITRDLSRAEGYAEDAFERYVQNPEGGPPIKRARIDSTEENEPAVLEVYGKVAGKYQWNTMDEHIDEMSLEELRSIDFSFFRDIYKGDEQMIIKPKQFKALRFAIVEIETPLRKARWLSKSLDNITKR